MSLEKEFEIAAGEILLWIISFAGVVKLPRLHDAQLWIVFSFYCSVALCMILGFQLISISVPVCDFGVELHTQDLVKFLQRRLFQDIFKMAEGRSFIHSFVEQVERLRIFIHSDGVELLY